MGYVKAAMLIVKEEVAMITVLSHSHLLRVQHAPQIFFLDGQTVLLVILAIILLILVAIGIVFGSLIVFMLVRDFPISFITLALFLSS